YRASFLGMTRTLAIRKILASLLALTIGCWLQVAPAQAQSLRTYVSGTGKDGTACSMSSPCQTLQAAMAKTLASGEIYTLDSANYGYVTITKAVSIIGEGGAAGVLASSSVSGVTINAGASDVINLRGLYIDGGGSGTTGIQFTSGGSLNIQNSVIR